jgi:hypothetical protein
MKANSSALPLSVGALALGVTAQAAALLSGHTIDVSEWLGAIHGFAEQWELDELLIGLVVLALALAIDVIRTRAAAQVKGVEVERDGVEQSNRTLLDRCDRLERRNATLHETRARLVENERLAWAVVSRLRRGLLNRLAGASEALETARQESRTLPAPHLVESLAQLEAELRKITDFVAGLPDVAESDRASAAASPSA